MRRVVRRSTRQAFGGGRELCGEVLLPVGLPVPGQEFLQTGLRQVGDTVEDIGEPGLRIDVVELRGADERVHDSGPHAPAVGAGEQPRFASETDAAQRPLGGVVRKADLTVVEEAREAAPALQHIIHGLGHGGVTREPGALQAHPVLKFRDQRRAPLLAHREATLGSLAVDLALDVEERVDPLHGLQRQR